MKRAPKVEPPSPTVDVNSVCAALIRAWIKRRNPFAVDVTVLSGPPDNVRDATRDRLLRCAADIEKGLP